MEKLRSFSGWKTQVVLKLILLKQKYANDAKIVDDVNAILAKLHYAKVRNLSTVLSLIYEAGADSKEFLELLPTPEEVEAWFKSHEE